MTPCSHVLSSISPQARSALFILGISLSVALAISVVGIVGGFRLNTTPSEPLGLWRVETLDRPVQIGDVVFVCPPLTAAITEGFERGYLRSGLCPGGFGPLIKTVAAVAGQRVQIGTAVVINGQPIDHSQLVERDGQGRALRPYRGGTVPAGEVFLQSPFVGSWDSRYFGPVPASGILGLADQVLTYAP
jgi:conjugative transfer signal peptidase TraF